MVCASSRTASRTAHVAVFISPSCVCVTLDVTGTLYTVDMRRLLGIAPAASSTDDACSALLGGVECS